MISSIRSRQECLIHKRPWGAGQMTAAALLRDWLSGLSAIDGSRVNITYFANTSDSTSLPSKSEATPLPVHLLCLQGCLAVAIWGQNGPAQGPFGEGLDVGCAFGVHAGCPGCIMNDSGGGRVCSGCRQQDLSIPYLVLPVKLLQMREGVPLTGCPLQPR